MLEAILERIQRTLLVDRMAVFLADMDSPAFVLAKSSGIAQTGWLDLSFLSSQRPELAEGHLFFDNTHQAVREEPTAQETIRRARSELLHSLHGDEPHDCDARTGQDERGRLPFQRRRGVAGNLGRIHRHRAAERAAVCIAGREGQEYERLKEFNENIVESINVGVFAADLQDKIESWNSQMEVMYALPRAQCDRQIHSRCPSIRLLRGVLPRAQHSRHP